MSEEEEGEHALQITGTHERPAPNIHIGLLVSHPQEKCRRQLAVAALPDCGAAPGRVPRFISLPVPSGQTQKIEQSAPLALRPDTLFGRGRGHSLAMGTNNDPGADRNALVKIDDIGVE